MKTTKTLITAALLSLSLTSAASAENVTSSPLAQRSLAVATAYWGRAACASITVEVAPITEDAESSPGVLIPPSDVWAETRLNGCTMHLAPEVWEIQTALPGLQKADEAGACEVIVHEFGHTLGLGDTTAVGIMNASPEERPAVPACRETSALTPKKKKSHHR